MKPKSRAQIFRFTPQDIFFPLVLLVTLIIAYGLPMLHLGFQGDDWHLIWLQYRIGNLSPFFNLTRVSTQWAFQLFMPLLAPIPAQWIWLNVGLRWLGGMGLFLLINALFPGKKQWAGSFCLLFCLYPGYLMSFFPVTFLAALLQPAGLFFSFYFMVLSLKKDDAPRGWLTALALVCSTANLLLSEYFLFLELLRPFLIQRTLQLKEKKSLPTRRVFQVWKSYLLLFLAFLGWRIYTQVRITGRGMLTLEKFLTQPFAYAWQMISQVFQDFNTMMLQPLAAALTPTFELQTRQGWLGLGSALLVTLLTFFYLLRQPAGDKKNRNAWKFMLFAGLSFFLAALPFWLAGIKPYFGFEMLNRAALPQGLSFTLLLFAMFQYLPADWKWLHKCLISLLAGSFTLLQLNSAGLFRAEWERRKDLMQQLAWRAPQLESGTVLLMNNPEFLLSGENSLSAELNWNYLREPHPRQAEYFIYFNEHRFLGDFIDIHANRTQTQMHMFGPTALNPTHRLALQFDSIGCLRILDPQMDALDKGIAGFTHGYISDTDLSVIQANSVEESLMLEPAIYGSEAAHGWCYYYQKTDLARQLGDWQTAGDYARRGLELLPSRPEPAELRPIIEALAHTGAWQTAQRLTETILSQSTDQNRILCALWQRMAAATPASDSRSESLAWMTSRTGCNFSGTG